VLRGARFALAGCGRFELGGKRGGDALDVAALRRMTGEQEQAGITGHEWLVEAKTQAGANRKLHINELGD
jgi:hypothetical protein